MNQYSPKNQAYLLRQLPGATDVRPFKAWKAAGRSVIKGEKALRVWIPKVRGDGADPEKLTEEQRNARFVRGPVFDISQTKESTAKQSKGAQSERTAHNLDAMYTAYDAAISAGDIPADLDFSIWYELTMESRATIAAPADDEYTESDDTPKCIGCMDNGCELCLPIDAIKPGQRYVGVHHDGHTGPVIVVADINEHGSLRLQTENAAKVQSIMPVTEFAHLLDIGRYRPAAGTIATQEGVVIAQYQHVTA